MSWSAASINKHCTNRNLSEVHWFALRCCHNYIHRSQGQRPPVIIIVFLFTEVSIQGWWLVNNGILTVVVETAIILLPQPPLCSFSGGRGGRCIRSSPELVQCHGDVCPQQCFSYVTATLTKTLLQQTWLQLFSQGPWQSYTFVYHSILDYPDSTVAQSGVCWEAEVALVCDENLPVPGRRPPLCCWRQLDWVAEKTSTVSPVIQTRTHVATKTFHLICRRENSVADKQMLASQTRWQFVLRPSHSSLFFFFERLDNVHSRHHTFFAVFVNSRGGHFAVPAKHWPAGDGDHTAVQQPPPAIACHAQSHQRKAAASYYLWFCCVCHTTKPGDNGTASGRFWSDSQPAIRPVDSSIVLKYPEDVCPAEDEEQAHEDTHIHSHAREHTPTNTSKHPHLFFLSLYINY